MMIDIPSVDDFKMIDDGGNKRISIFGQGYTGFTLGIYDDRSLCEMAHYFYMLGREHEKK